MFPRSTMVFATDPAGGAPAVTVVDPPQGDPVVTPTMVPVHELVAERQRRQALEAQNKALLDAAEAVKQADMTENERLKAQLASLTVERDTLKTTLTVRDKSDLVRKHAAKFHNPEDAVALLTARGLLATLEDDGQAESAVKGLALESPHLLRHDGPGVDLRGLPIEQVLQDGLQVGPQPQGASPAPADSRDDGRTFTYAEAKSWTPAQWAELRMKNPAGYQRTLIAVGQG